jgi:hypothetical protein
MMAYCYLYSMMAFCFQGIMPSSMGGIVEKNEAKTTLRYPQKLKEEFKRIAEEEGLSENAALVQALVWALKFRGQMHVQ